jgi:hypothetical protein
MMVPARDGIYRMSAIKGKKIGITRSLDTIKNDGWRIQEHQGGLGVRSGGPWPNRKPSPSKSAV